jgi:deazaflavin-dependent oxidoreductase (nitroreductase family)
MAASDRELRARRVFQRFVVDPPVRLIWRVGLAPPGDAELETTGRRTGRPHRVRICNGLVGKTVWLIAQHGRRTDYVLNIETNPQVRFRTGPHRRWRTGVAYILDSDDPRARRRLLEQGNAWRRMCMSASHVMSTDPLTIRVNLDEESDTFAALRDHVPG